MKKVKLLVNTAYKGPRVEGDIVSVPDDFAARWVKNKIAEFVEGEDEVIEEEVAQAPVEEEKTEEETETEEEVDLGALTAKELFNMCVEKGIEVEAKKSKAYYIEKLEEQK